VDTEDRRVLIDTGIGNKQDDKFRRRYRVEQVAPIQSLLAGKDIPFETVTDVVLTHLHFDHVGGAVTAENGRFVPSFPNATYWVTESQWGVAMNPNPRERASYLAENLVPLQDAGVIRFFTADAWDVPEIVCAVSDGHTVGQLIPRVHIGGRQVIFLGDLIPSIHHVPLPFIMAYDIQPLVLLKEKEALLCDAADNGHVLFFEHDPVHACCTVRHGERGVEVDRTFDLADLENELLGGDLKRETE